MTLEPNRHRDVVSGHHTGLAGPPAQGGETR
jgi:hypothetical protein